jgi:hypothetical protein
LKLIEENIKKTFEDTGIGKTFLNRAQIAQEIKIRIDKWGCTKLKTFCTAKETIARIKSQHIELEKIFANYSVDKGLISRKYEELQKLNTKTNDQINEWTTDLIDSS